MKALGTMGTAFASPRWCPFPTTPASRRSPGFVSLEGDLAGRLTISGLEACGREFSRECFIEAFHTSDAMDIDGFQREYGPNDNQGSDAVFLAVIGGDGKYHQIGKLGDAK